MEGALFADFIKDPRFPSGAVVELRSKALPVEGYVYVKHLCRWPGAQTSSPPIRVCLKLMSAEPRSLRHVKTRPRTQINWLVISDLQQLSGTKAASEFASIIRIRIHNSGPGISSSHTMQ